MRVQLILAMSLALAFVGQGIVLAQSPAGPAAKEMNGLPLVFEEDFEKGAERWEPTDAAAWKVADDEGSKVFSLFTGSKYEPAVRSPKNIAWIKELNVGDCVIEVRMKQTGREYGHRDMCVFLGGQDATHFYYVHMATKADEHANSIFLVDNKPRVSIAKERTDGTDWATGYHTVRVTRDLHAGTIEVFFDDMTKPIMTTVDKTFGAGRIGFGSFDDTGNIDNVRVWGK